MKPFFTLSQTRTLFLLLRHPGVNAESVSEMLWPGNSMHTKSSGSGTNGSCRGKAARLCGGSYVAKLRMKGWVRVFYGPEYAVFQTLTGWDQHRLSGGTGYYLTEVGLEVLKREALAPCLFCGAISLDTFKFSASAFSAEEEQWNHAAACPWLIERQSLEDAMQSLEDSMQRLGNAMQSLEERRGEKETP